MIGMDEILEKVGLKYEELTTAERETLHGWMEALSQNTLTIESVKTYIVSMRDAVEHELSGTKDAPQSWLSLLSFLIPLIGIIRKWYQDQHEIELKARLRNYRLIEAFLSSPERAKRAIDQAIAGMASVKR